VLLACGLIIRRSVVITLVALGVVGALIELLQ